MKKLLLLLLGMTLIFARDGAHSGAAVGYGRPYLHHANPHRLSDWRFRHAIRIYTSSNESSLPIQRDPEPGPRHDHWPRGRLRLSDRRS